MQHNKWMAKLTLEIIQQLPQKYATSEFIEKRITTEDFNREDINQDFYYVVDVLKSRVICIKKMDNTIYPLSLGEYQTITMLDRCRDLGTRLEVTHLLLMAYLHDLDELLKKYLSSKVMAKFHRRYTMLLKSWDEELYGFWNPESAKYLPLDEEEFRTIENKLKIMSSQQLEKIFDSSDPSLFVEHFCEVIELAFGKKTFTIISFSLEACESALEQFF